MPECLRDADSINAVLERGTFERDFTLGMQALGFGREPLSHKDLMAGALTPNWPPLTPSQILHACYLGKERATAAIPAGVTRGTGCSIGSTLGVWASPATRSSKAFWASRLQSVFKYQLYYRVKLHNRFLNNDFEDVADSSSYRADWEPAATSGRRVLGVFWRCPAVLWGPSAPNPTQVSWKTLILKNWPIFPASCGYVVVLPHVAKVRFW